MHTPSAQHAVPAHFIEHEYAIGANLCPSWDMRMQDFLFRLLILTDLWSESGQAVFPF